MDDNVRVEKGDKRWKTIGFFWKLGAPHAALWLLNGRGGIWRRILPPVLGTLASLPILIAILQFFRSSGFEMPYDWFGFAALPIWFVLVLTGILYTKLQYRRNGLFVGTETALRFALGFPIVVLWLVLWALGLLLVLPTGLALASFIAAIVALSSGKNPSSLSYPVFGVSLLTLTYFVNRIYGPGDVLAYVLSVVCMVVALCMVVWISALAAKPLAAAERLLARFEPNLAESMDSAVKKAARKARREDADDEAEVEQAVQGAVEQQHKTLDVLEKMLRWLPRAQVVTPIVVMAYCVAVLLVCASFALSYYYLLAAPGGGISVAAPNADTSLIMHAVSLSLKALTGGDHPAVIVTGSFAEGIRLLQAVFTFWIVVLVVLLITTSGLGSVGDLGARGQQTVASLRSQLNNVASEDVEEDEGRGPDSDGDGSSD